MSSMRNLALFAACLMVSGSAHAQVKKSADFVKATYTAGKIEGGKQTVTITLDIDSKHHLYANPVGNPDMESVQTTVAFTSGTAKLPADLKFPAGLLKKEKVGGDYMIWKGKVVITAVVPRTAATTPLEAAIAIQACTDSSCKQPSTIKLKID